MRKLVTLLYSTLLGVLAATTRCRRWSCSIRCRPAPVTATTSTRAHSTRRGRHADSTTGFSPEGAGLDRAGEAVGDIRFIDYLGGGFSNQLLGELSGIFDWAVVPQRLHFIVEDDASVQPVNILQPNSPANVQQVNVLSFGPTLQFRLGPALRGEADFRVLNSVASKTDEFNSLRESARLRAIRDLAPTRQISFNVEGQHVHFTARPSTEWTTTATARSAATRASWPASTSISRSAIRTWTGHSAHRSSPLIPAP